jgi:uncharacterized membrane protein HdeD (DUF308 family)
VFFKWLLVFAGLIEFVDAFMVGQWAGFFLHMLAAILFGITGFLTVARPIISAEAVTFLMSMFFLFAGFYHLIASFWTHLPGWGWQALNGIIAAVMAFSSWRNGLPRGFRVIGLFVGILLPSKRIEASSPSSGHHPSMFRFW